MPENSEKKRSRAAPIVIAVLIALSGAAVAFRDKLDLAKLWGPAPKTTANSDAGPANPEARRRTAIPQLPDLQPAPASDGTPGFDIARISPDGVSVFAGRAAPNSSVTVLADGMPVGSVKADDNGEWILSTEHKFGNTDPKLALEAVPAGDRVAALANEALAPPKAEAPVVRPPASPSPPVAPPQPAAKPAGQEASRAAQPKSAEQVTTGMIENLERLVEAARKEEARGRSESAAAPAPAASPATAASDHAARTREEDVPKQVGVAEVPAPASAPAPMAMAATESPSAAASPGASVIPVPITFEYRNSHFTDEGRRAVSLLAEYVRLKGFASIELSGHADERGTDAENIVLSQQRLDAVARQLRDSGYAGKLELEAKGETEPYHGVDRSQYSREELFQLDRRVELRLAR